MATFGIDSGGVVTLTAEQLCNGFLKCADATGIPMNASGLNSVVAWLEGLVSEGLSIPTAAGVPTAAPDAGELPFYVDSDTQVLYHWDGTAWNAVCCGAAIPFGSGVPAAAPLDTDGNTFIDTDTQTLYYWDGAAWNPIGGGAVSLTGNGAPASAPAAGESTFYVDESTSPFNLYHWDGAAWNQVGDGAGAVSLTGSVPPVAAPAAGEPTFYVDEVSENLYHWDGTDWLPVSGGPVTFVDAPLGAATAIPAGVSVGDALVITGDGAFAYNTHAQITGSFFGNHRTTNTGAQSIGSGAHTTNWIRGGESVLARWDGARWVSSHDYNLDSGNTYRENEDGRYSVFAQAAIGVAGQVVAVPLPFAATNTLLGATSEFPRASAVDVVGAVFAAGDPIGATANDILMVSIGSPTQVGFACTNNVTGAFNFQLENVIRA